MNEPIVIPFSFFNLATTINHLAMPMLLGILPVSNIVTSIAFDELSIAMLQALMVHPRIISSSIIDNSGVSVKLPVLILALLDLIGFRLNEPTNAVGISILIHLAVVGTYPMKHALLLVFKIT